MVSGNFVLIPVGVKGILHSWVVSRRVGKGFPTHGVCQEGCERDFALTGSCQEGWERDFPPTGCVKKGVKGILHSRVVSRRVGKGFPTHGVCQEGWERDFALTCQEGCERDFVCQEGCERDFALTGRKIPRGWGIPSPPLLTHLTVSEKSPPWVGNPFPTPLNTPP